MVIGGEGRNTKNSKVVQAVFIKKDNLRRYPIPLHKKYYKISRLTLRVPLLDLVPRDIFY